MTKIDIISGFLGAGKTTFIKKLLEESISKEKTVLIENEYGQIGIDGGFLKESGIQMKEMISGCICCSLAGDFTTALQEMLEEYQPERVIIEPSGVGKLSDVIKAVEKIGNDKIVQNFAITIVDAKKCKLYRKNFGEFFENQIQYAKTIVLSRTDILEQERIEEAVKIIREINTEATIITTPISEISGKKLLEILESPIDIKLSLFDEIIYHHEHHHAKDCDCHEHHHTKDCDCHEHHHTEDCDCHEHHHAEDCSCHEHHHHASDVFESMGMEQVAPISKDRLLEILDKLANYQDFGQILRVKGMIPEKDTKNWFYFDLVPGEVEIRNGEADNTGKLCVIGSKLNMALIEEEFKKR